MENIRKNLANTVIALGLSIVLCIITNMVGYKFSLVDSIPGMAILAGLSLGGYFLSWVIPTKKISSVLWISILAILTTSPISPVANQVIEMVGKVHFMSVVTPILAYAGVVVGKDWGSFKKVGLKGIVVTIFVIAGTFLISALLGDLLMNVL